MICMIFVKHGIENNKSKRYSYLEKENEPNMFRPIDAHVVDRELQRTLHACSERKAFCPVASH